jgi:8-oxo-dGTP diphosphatase
MGKLSQPPNPRGICYTRRSIRSAVGSNMDKIGVSQKAIVINGEGKLLAIRRSKTAPSRPLTWDFPGGDVDFGENLEASIIREIKEETGFEADKLELLDVHSYINPDGYFWITIAYKTEVGNNDVSLSYEHDKFQWVAPEEFLRLKSADKLQGFVKKMITKS